MAAAATRPPVAVASGSRPLSREDLGRRAQLAELQRQRILGATLEVAYERGAAGTSIARVVARSGVSRRTFYELFADREACFLAALERALCQTADCVVPAYETQRGWRERIRAGLVAMLALFDEQPQLGRMLVCESLAGGPQALALRNRVLEQLTDVVEDSRSEDKRSTVALPLLGDGVVGGVLMVLQKQLSESGKESLLSLTNSLMSMIVLPYLGPGAARRELNRAVSAPANVPRSALLAGDPFKAVGMRMTYRTIRVLLAVGEHTGASNRQVGRTAGVEDQGQISKLLSRLQRAGLIENIYTTPGRGAANAWALTEMGRRLTDSIRTHTESAGKGLQQRERER